MDVVWVGHGCKYLAWWGGCGQGIPLGGVKAGAGGVKLGPRGVSCVVEALNPSTAVGSRCPSRPGA